MARRIPAAAALMAAVLVLCPALDAHGVAGRDARLLQSIDGLAIGPFLYLGAKHMVTGYDHLLFLAGVVFFLYSPRHIVLYVSLFTLGHSVTLLGGALLGWRVNPYLIDAIIGFSVVYKAFENMGGFRRLGWQPDPRGAVLLFGLFHGLGLATKLQDLTLSRNGLVGNIISFNIGVEIGQALALGFVLIALVYWRRQPNYVQHAFGFNVALMVAGFVLIGYQLAGYAETSVARREAAAAAAIPPPAADGKLRFDRAQFVLGPYDFVEYKYRLEQGGGMVFSWEATAPVMNDFHGVPDADHDKEVSFSKQERRSHAAAHTAPFPGMHGFFWENPGPDPITVTLTSSGFYTVATEYRANGTRTNHELKEQP